jgi:hypothetical protein
MTLKTVSGEEGNNYLFELQKKPNLRCELVQIEMHDLGLGNTKVFKCHVFFEVM